MTAKELPSEVKKIKDWLSEQFYNIQVSCKHDNIYTITALKEMDNQIFEIDINYNFERNTALLKISCLREIYPERFYFCIELLNYLNIHNAESKFSINPSTLILSCSQVIGFATWEAESGDHTEGLNWYAYFFIEDLAKIAAILEDNVNLENEVHKIGDVPIDRNLGRQE